MIAHWKALQQIVIVLPDMKGCGWRLDWTNSHCCRLKMDKICFYISHCYILLWHLMRTLTFTHNPKDFKFIHYITDVRDLHEVKRYVAWGAWSSSRGGPSTGWYEVASCWLLRGVCRLYAIISATCLLWRLAFTCTKTFFLIIYMFKYSINLPASINRHWTTRFVVKWIHNMSTWLLCLFSKTFLKKGLFKANLTQNSSSLALAPQVKRALQQFSIALPFSRGTFKSQKSQKERSKSVNPDFKAPSMGHASNTLDPTNPRRQFKNIFYTLPNAMPPVYNTGFLSNIWNLKPISS